jgi:hypothetical protein
MTRFLASGLLAGAALFLAFLAFALALTGTWGASSAYGTASAVLLYGAVRGIRRGGPWTRRERSFLKGRAPMPEKREKALWRDGDPR